MNVDLFSVKKHTIKSLERLAIYDLLAKQLTTDPARPGAAELPCDLNRVSDPEGCLNVDLSIRNA